MSKLAVSLDKKNVCFQYLYAEYLIVLEMPGLNICFENLIII